MLFCVTWEFIDTSEAGIRRSLGVFEKWQPPDGAEFKGFFGFTDGTGGMALVEVDVDTGQVKLLRYVVAHDCGRVINPMIVDGQISGGVAQGIGGGLYEELVYDASGQFLSGSFMDYLLPTCAEIPPIEMIHLEYPSPRNPLGIKGVGEGGAISPPAAIANAVEDALQPFGVCIRETPLTPERVRHLIIQWQTA